MANDLKNLSRMELLQILLQVTESNEALLAENAELRNAPSIQVSRSAKVGSIAEAALQANGFFEAAQRSADEYLREVKKLRDEMVERSRTQAAAQASAGISGEDELEQSRLFERIQEQAKTYIQDVQTYANNVMARASAQAQDILDEAHAQSDEIIAQANDRAKAIIEEAEAIASEKQAVPAEELQAEEPQMANAREESLLEDAPLEDAPADDAGEEREPIEPAQVEEASQGAIEAGLPWEEAVSIEGAQAELAWEEEQEAGKIPAALPEEAPAPVFDEPDSQTAVPQTTAPLSIDPIVAEIAAGAYDEAALDPNSTGALVRRGRHVKLPEGTAV